MLELEVKGTGAVSSVGFSMPATCAAIQSGVDCFAETQFFDGIMNPVIGARIPDPDAQDNNSSISGGLSRAARYLAMSIEEACFSAGVKPSRLILILVLADEKRPTTLPAAQIAEATSAACHELLGQGTIASTTVATEGATGFHQALAEANRILQADPRQSIVIASFDSWLNSASLEHGLAPRKNPHSRFCEWICSGRICSSNSGIETDGPPGIRVSYFRHRALSGGKALRFRRILHGNRPRNCNFNRTVAIGNTSSSIESTTGKRIWRRVLLQRIHICLVKGHPRQIAP